MEGFWKLEVRGWRLEKIKSNIQYLTSNIDS